MYPTPGVNSDSTEGPDSARPEPRIAGGGAPVAPLTYFRWEEFVDSLGDEELAAEIVALFIVEAPALVDRVRAAVNGESNEEIRQAAHAFKGAVGNLTRRGPMETSARIESIARAETRAGTQALMVVLDEQVAGLLEELKAVRLPNGPCEF
jgi:HPt (histidine-containing phosphotransfer) domain-containing protein